MPNWFPSWTKCVDPADYRGIPYGAMITIGSVGILMGVIAMFAAIAPGVAIILAGLCLAAIALCNWWLDVRLICLGGDRSAIGVVYHLEPPVQESNPFNFKANFENADTDFSFNLLLWQFTPIHSLPQSFVDNQWSPGAFAQLGTDWPTLPPLVPDIPFSQVSDQINQIVPQQSMASLGLGFGGQNIEKADIPAFPPPGFTKQHFLMHCEIEGPGMHDLLILLEIMAAVFVAAAFVYAIPVVGPILSWILIALALLAFLIGSPAVTHSDASPPSTGWGGSVNPFDPANAPEALVEPIYVFGRWVYDSFHANAESNELHPVHYICKMKPVKQGDLSNGIWPQNMGEIQLKYDAQFAVINSPTTIEIQKLPQNRWQVHPLLDGCLSGTPYPDPPAPVIV